MNAKRKYFNIRGVREYLGLSQEEYGSLIGVTGMYISQIENGKRPLNDNVAENIVRGLIKFSDLLSNDKHRSDKYKEWEIKFFAYDVKWYHLASFYPEEVQDRIILLAKKKQAIQDELDYLLENGSLLEDDPFPTIIPYDNSKKMKEEEYPLLYEYLIETDIESVVKNVIEFKTAYAVKKGSWSLAEENITKWFPV